MEILFKKYKPAPDGTLHNYFEPAVSNVLEDSLILNKLPIESFPVFNIEAEDVNDFFQIKPSDFDITVSFLETKRTSLNKSVKEFFTLIENCKILVIFKYGGINFSGFIDISSIDKNYTFQENHNEITFTVAGILKEFSDYYKTVPLKKVEIDSPLSFDSYFNEGYHFTDVYAVGSSGKALINNQLYIQNRTGFKPIVYKKLQNSIYDRNIDVGFCNQWKTFEETAQQLGFVYLLEVRNSTKYNAYPQFELIMFWRNSGGAVTIDKIMEHHEGYNLPDTNKFIVLRPYEWIYVQGQGEGRQEFTMSEGVIFNNTSLWYIDSRYNLFNNLHWQQFCHDLKYRMVTPPIGIEATKSTVLGHFTTNTYVWEEDIANQTEELTIPTDNTRYSTAFINNFLPAGVAMYSRIFHEGNGALSSFTYDYGSVQLYLATFSHEYQILLSGFRETRRYKIRYNENTTVKLFSKVFIGEKIFFVNRITDLNLIEQSATIDLLQL